MLNDEELIMYQVSHVDYAARAMPQKVAFEKVLRLLEVALSEDGPYMGLKAGKLIDANSPKRSADESCRPLSPESRKHMQAILDRTEPTACFSVSELRRLFGEKSDVLPMQAYDQVRRVCEDMVHACFEDAPHKASSL